MQIKPTSARADTYVTYHAPHQHVIAAHKLFHNAVVHWLAEQQRRAIALSCANEHTNLASQHALSHLVKRSLASAKQTVGEPTPQLIKRLTWYVAAEACATELATQQNISA